LLKKPPVTVDTVTNHTKCLFIGPCVEAILSIFQSVVNCQNELKNDKTFL